MYSLVRFLRGSLYIPSSLYAERLARYLLPCLPPAVPRVLLPSPTSYPLVVVWLLLRLRLPCRIVVVAALFILVIIDVDCVPTSGSYPSCSFVRLHCRCGALHLRYGLLRLFGLRVPHHTTPPFIPLFTVPIATLCMYVYVLLFKRWLVDSHYCI